MRESDETHGGLPTADSRSTASQKGCSKRAAILLDRDGVINVSPGHGKSITAPDDLQLLPGVGKAISSFRELGALVIVVTNQRCIQQRLLSLEGLQQIHDRLHLLLREEGAALDDIFFCPHADEDRCHCRKPKPGMLFDAAARHNIDLTHSVMIGDATRDLQAGSAAGCRTVAFGDSELDIALSASHGSIQDWSLHSRRRVLDLLLYP